MKINQEAAWRHNAEERTALKTINPLRPNSDPSQTSHCNIKGLSAREVMRIENMITQVKFSPLLL